MRGSRITGLLAAEILGMAALMDVWEDAPIRSGGTREDYDLKKPGVIVHRPEQSPEVIAWNAAVDAKKAERKQRRQAAKESRA